MLSAFKLARGFAIALLTVTVAAGSIVARDRVGAPKAAYRRRKFKIKIQI